MTLTREERNAIVEHRLENAAATLQEAKTLVNSEQWRGAANRLYYACYYAVTALLIKNGHITRSHSGVIVLLGKHFVVTNIISREDNKLYRRLFDLRQGGDYSDWVDIEEEDIVPLVEPAGKFIETIKQLVINE